jgi:hypothetical protein
MGSLTPGASYTYEYIGDTVYAREVGKSDRKIIGYHFDSYSKNLTLEYELETIWKDIIKESWTNAALQDALERVKIIYYLSKENGKE